MLCFMGVSSIKPVTVWLGADRDEAHFLTREVGDKNGETTMEERFVWCRFQPEHRGHGFSKQSSKRDFWSFVQPQLGTCEVAGQYPEPDFRCQIQPNHG